MTLDAFSRIGVLCGGPSHEREISLRSGRAVCEALASLELPVTLVELSPDTQRIPEEIKRAQIDCAFVALHGAFGEDGGIQSLLEEMRIPYTGSSAEASHFAMDKVFSRRRWLAAGLAVPKWVQVEAINAESRLGDFSFPLVVKPVSQGSSFGVHVVDSARELPGALEEAARYGEKLLLEEYLAGAEVTVGILEERALPVIQIVPKRRFYDYIAKYTPGMTEYLVPTPLPRRQILLIQEMALRAHRALGCRSFSRVDMMVTPHRGPVLLELNTIPGMTATSLLPKAAAACGIGFPELCRRMLYSSIEGQAACRTDAVRSSASV